MPEFRGDLLQGNKHESTLLESWVWNDQVLFSKDLVCVKKDINIEGAWCPPDRS